MPIVANGIGHHLPLEAACDDNADLALERHPLLEHHLSSLVCWPDGFQIRFVSDLLLPLTVVAEACGLEYTRSAEFLHRGGELFLVVYFDKPRQRQAGITQKRFLPKPMLADVQDFAFGAHHTLLRCPGNGLARDVFDLKSQHIDAAR